MKIVKNTFFMNGVQEVTGSNPTLTNKAIFGIYFLTHFGFSQCTYTKVLDKNSFKSDIISDEN